MFIRNTVIIKNGRIGNKLMHVQVIVQYSHKFIDYLKSLRTGFIYEREEGYKSEMFTISNEVAATNKTVADLIDRKVVKKASARAIDNSSTIPEICYVIIETPPTDPEGNVLDSGFTSSFKGHAIKVAYPEDTNSEATIAEVNFDSK